MMKRALFESDDYDGRPVTLDDYATLAASMENSPEAFFFDLQDIDGDKFVVLADVNRLEDHIVFPSPNTDTQFMRTSADLDENCTVNLAEFKMAIFGLEVRNYIESIDEEVVNAMFKAL